MNRLRLSSRTRTWLALAVLLLTSARHASAQELRLPMKDGSVRFAVMGDNGTGTVGQYEVARQMAAYHASFPFEFVIMCGDNLYGGSGPKDYRKKFEQPYADLLAAKVRFYAVLGNHDNPAEVNYEGFNMGGRRYYTWRGSAGGLARIGGTGVRFFALDTTNIDKPQLDWLESELKKSSSDWKIAFFHHPIYSSGRTHGSSLGLRVLLEPLFINYGVSVVFSGHDHVYERIKPQHGITYFVSGAGGALRKGNIDRDSSLTDVGFDSDCHFMLVEIDGLDLYFQTISRTGQTVDAGVIHHMPFAEETAPASPLPPLPDSTQVPLAPVSPSPPGATPPDPPSHP